MKLLTAAEKGDLEALRALLKQGAPLDTEKEGEDTALGVAAMYGQLEAARVLLDAGADVNHRGAWGRTALHYAAGRSLALTSLLIDRGADLRARHDGDSDALDEHIVHDDADPAIVTRLIDAGFDLTARPTKYRLGETHLMLACFRCRLDVVERLLAAGVNPGEGDPLGQALSAGVHRDRIPAVIALLVKGGLDANFESRRHGLTILMAVCQLGDLESARLLLDRGADPNARRAGTPLTCAEESGNKVLVDLLLERGAQPERPGLSPEAARSREQAEQAARAQPADPILRLAWGRVLAAQGCRAAAASEFAAAERLGAPGLETLREALTFENPPGTRWTFAPFEPVTSKVAAAVDDARFPGARVTSGSLTLPLVIVLGPPCTRCDELGETVCTDCDGSGTRGGFTDPDAEYPCAPRQLCTNCAGLKYVVNAWRFGKGSCKHERKLSSELQVSGSELSRCPSCGLAALSTGGYWSMMFACGVCALFACRCRPGG